MLGAMFSGRHELKFNDEGRYFIDRNGEYFGYLEGAKINKRGKDKGGAKGDEVKKRKFGKFHLSSKICFRILAGWITHHPS
jgi:hypothetical protein